jgi:hypothetical protein
MKKILFPAIISAGFFGVLILGSCSEKKSSDSTQVQQSQASEKDFRKMIDSLEAKLFKDPYTAANRGLAMNLMRVYDDYSRYYPKDSLTPEYLFKAAELAAAIQVPASAITYYKKIEEKYPAFRKLDQCIFLQGFVYESLMNDTANAAQNYRRLIKLYPNSTFVKDAEASILNLGKSPEELIREFERNQKGA